MPDINTTTAWDIWLAECGHTFRFVVQYNKNHQPPNMPDVLNKKELDIINDTMAQWQCEECDGYRRQSSTNDTSGTY